MYVNRVLNGSSMYMPLWKELSKRRYRVSVSSATIMPVIAGVLRLADREAAALRPRPDRGRCAAGSAATGRAATSSSPARRGACHPGPARARSTIASEPTAAAARTADAAKRRSETATTVAATSSMSEPTASTWSVPSSGISQNAVTKVPTMLPAVDTANSLRRPAEPFQRARDQPDRDRRHAPE